MTEVSQTDEPDGGNPATVTWEELRDAFDFVNSAPAGENTAFLSLASGQIELVSVWTEIWTDPDDDGAEEAGAGDRTMSIPHKTELGLGRELALWFVEEVIPDRYEQVELYFRKRGAYAKFKTLLTEEGLLQDWYEFEKTAEEQALRNWCEENGLSVLDSDPTTGSD